MKSFRKNISAVYFATAVNGLLGVLFVPVALSTLGHDGFGLYAIYATLVAYAALIDLGVSKNLSRLLAARTTTDAHVAVLRQALGVYLLLGLVVITMAVPLAVIVPTYVFPVAAEHIHLVRFLVYLALAEYVMSIPVNLLVARAVAEERFMQYTKYNLLVGFLRYGLMFGACLWFQSPTVLAMALLLRRPLEYLLAYRVLGRLPAGSWRPQFERRAIFSMLGHSSVLSVAQFMQLMVITAGAVLVNRYFGLSALGSYRAAFDLANRIWFFSNGMGLVIFPRFVRLNASKDGRHVLRRVLTPALLLSWWGYMTLAGILACFAPWIMSILRVDDPLIQPWFVLLALGVALNAHANLNYEMLQSRGQYGSVVALSTMAFVLLLAFFFAVHEMTSVGPMAVGWAWVGSQAAYAMLGDSLVTQMSSRTLLLRMLMLGGALLVATFVSGREVLLTYGALAATLACILMLGREMKQVRGLPR